MYLLRLGTVNFIDVTWQGRAPYAARVFRGCRMGTGDQEMLSVIDGGSTWGKDSPAAGGPLFLSPGLVHVVIVNNGTKES